MALEHEFYLIPKTANIQEYWQYTHEERTYLDCVVLHDDLILYIMDSLKWIPTKNPGIRNMPAGYGINYHGLTLFDNQSAITLRNVFSAWRDLFENAPKVMKLTGSFVWSDKEEGEYERLILNRNLVIMQLERMITMAEKLLDGEVYIYHSGI
ncbi:MULTISPECIES: hypothetical protein [Bacillaceae]|uniref:hypothetical protein n=1 Tax=Bacillaceae TaxID=186817 RepID=UPI001E586670|nr:MULTISPECIES: hypothetical protein [Bacillaceae]MCE4049337.1 hypothetical protein [Bacillus sp. Au-Bac7]MCM3032358.1 hypothetical protein [Niallia sp. MER 6]